MEKIPVIKGQLLDFDGTPFGPPLLARSPIVVCNMLLGEDGEWQLAVGEEGPLATFSLVWMTEEELDNLPEWEGP